MASLLRQIVAGPRARHEETGLDLCYVTDRIIATSGPSGTYPKRYYRNPLEHLVKFLDTKHGENWTIWEFRAEGTGYPDSEVHGRIWHFPFPDHHPPPFVLIPNIVASMRNWMNEDEKRVVVVHCKAGKGRSGTAACSYLMSEEGWAMEDAMKRFTERRMKPGFGEGISIPSQVRWLKYVQQWIRQGKQYVEQSVRVVEIHIYGLRGGVTIGIDGFVDEGRTIKTFHTFTNDEREIIKGELPPEGGLAEVVGEVVKRTKRARSPNPGSQNQSGASTPTNTQDKSHLHPEPAADHEHRPSATSCDVVMRPSKEVVLPTNDINISIERRYKGGYMFNLPTSIAHVWFNAFLESTKSASEERPKPANSGLFEVEWAALDGIKGREEKGTQSFDRLSVAWAVATDNAGEKIQKVVLEPKEGDLVEQTTPADWHIKEGGNQSPVPDSDEEEGLQSSEVIANAELKHESADAEAKPVGDETKTAAENGKPVVEQAQDGKPSAAI